MTCKNNSLIWSVESYGQVIPAKRRLTSSQTCRISDLDGRGARECASSSRATHVGTRGYPTGIPAGRPCFPWAEKQFSYFRHSNAGWGSRYACSRFRACLSKLRAPFDWLPVSRWKLAAIKPRFVCRLSGLPLDSNSTAISRRQSLCRKRLGREEFLSRKRKSETRKSTRQIWNNTCAGIFVNFVLCYAPCFLFSH